MSRIALRVTPVGLAVLLLAPMAATADGNLPVLNLRARVVPASAGGTLTLTVFRWSTDAERAPLLASLSGPPIPPASPAAADGRAGRAGRGGRGGPPPPTPLQRLGAAVKGAPTLGYIWSEGVTGYSIKYAWHSRSTTAAGSGTSSVAGRGFSAGDRVVLVTDRRLDAYAPESGFDAGSSPEPDFTVIELRLDAAGAVEGKTSLSAGVIVDPAAQTLAVNGFAAAPTLFKVAR